MIVSVVEGKTHQFTHLIGSLGDTEHIIVIKAISAEAVTIDFFIIAKKAIIQIR